MLNPDIIIRPYATEKATAVNVYTFVVRASATKPLIKQAITEIYKVTPLKINISQAPGKKILFRGRPGRRPGFKKAIVYLKKGDKIET